jgi:hypothetical protein
MEEKSRPLGNRPNIVATNPAWARLGGKHRRTGHPSARRPELQTARVEDPGAICWSSARPASKRREVLPGTTKDRLLNTKWRMLAPSKLMSRRPRYVAIRDGVLNHMAQLRGQRMVYPRARGPASPYARERHQPHGYYRTKVYTISIQEY